MPEMISYTVTQTREVKVTANSMVDAIRIAEVAFDKGQNADCGINTKDIPDDMKGVWGNTRSFVKEIDIHAERR
jgi:hypothetical protein